MGDRENLQQCTSKFIDLANKLKDDGQDTKLISAALMAASGFYATYTVAGNSGALAPSGVDKVANAYRRNLKLIQERKKEQVLSQQQAQNESG